MKKPSLPVMIVTGIILALSALVIALLVFISNQPKPMRGVEPLVVIAAMEPDSYSGG